MQTTWKQYRYFLAHLHEDRRVHLLRTKYNPTWSSHGTLYGYCEGPFRTKKAAIQRAAYAYPYYPLDDCC